MDALFLNRMYLTETSFSFMPSICVSVFHNKQLDKADHSGLSPNISNLAMKTRFLFHDLEECPLKVNSLREHYNFPQ